ncbi:early secretory antigenic target protein ESAT-6 [Kitasatospora sp. GAS204A]|uniref:WXG100 family type VII secretion target n=1 Tax=unclassified Kitasatospora TaxID=2633591 RepID=UPI0024748875|nr:WXG100 family type VII secretion target [Kitasatospora sp. GAS204B]MDH6122448.1 early secretory antigenic target protein ESAT-6 [Kitasatospora sp. GAS204B]
MSDGHIKVNFSTIQDAGSEVRATAGRIQQQLDDLKAGVQRIASSWTGSAQEGYQARQATWDQKAADLHNTLNQIAAALDNAHQSYTSTENANAQIWAG